MILFHGMAVLLTVGVGAFFLIRRRFALPELLQSLLLLLCASIQAIEVFALHHPEVYFLLRKNALALESLLPLLISLMPLWLFQGGRLRFPTPWQGGAILLALAFCPLVLLQPVTALFFNPDIAREPVLFSGRYGFWFFLCLTLYCCYGLYILEQGILGLDREERWRGKHQVFGWGLILVAQAFCYSQGVIYRTYDLAYLPVKSVGLGGGALFILYSRYWRGDVAKIMLSRRLALRSLVLLGAGAYFLAMAVVGKGFPFLDGARSRQWLGLLLYLGGAGLVALLLMERTRRRFYVLLHKHFYQNKFDYREQWFEFTRRLSRAENERHLYRTILEYVCSTFGLQGAALYVRQEEAPEIYQGVFYDTCSRLPMPAHLPADAPLFQVMGTSDWVLNKQHGNEARAFEDVLAGLPLRFLVPVPFGTELGAVIVLGEPLNPHESYAYEDFDLMRMVAAQAGTVLHGLQLRGQLTSAREMAAIGKVSTFVVHDLKNVATGLGMMLDNARDYLADPEFQEDMLETVENSVSQMNALMHRLRHLREKPTLNLQRVALDRLVADALAAIPEERVEAALQPVVVDADPEEMRKVVVNLVHNALEACDSSDPIQVTTGNAPRPYIRVADTGCGMSDTFMRTRLFKPLETTKAKGMGIGLYHCRNIVETHGGEIEVSSREGEGSLFTVWLPADNEEIVRGED